MIGRTLLLLASLPAAVAACARAPAPAPVTTVAQACADRASAACARLATCRPSELTWRFGDLATCLDRAALACASDADLRDPAPTPDEVEACATETAGSTCDVFDLLSPGGPACANLARGSGGVLAPCSVGSQCASGTCTFDISPSSTCGTCTDVIPEGGPCTPPIVGNLHPCDVGLRCSATTGQCTAPKRAGEACEADARFACAPGLGCRRGVCVPLLGEGDACDDTISDRCDPARELICDLAAGRCRRAPYVLGVPGTRCGDPIQPVTCVRSLCTRRAHDGAMVCTPFRDDGRLCDGDALSPAPCLYPAVCDGVQCGLPDPALCDDM